jgi:hypothetical protein
MASLIAGNFSCLGLCLSPSEGKLPAVHRPGSELGIGCLFKKEGSEEIAAKSWGGESKRTEGGLHLYGACLLQSTSITSTWNKRGH